MAPSRLPWLLGVAVPGVLAWLALKWPAAWQVLQTPGTPAQVAKTVRTLFAMLLAPDDKRVQIEGCNWFGHLGNTQPAAKQPLMAVGAMDLCARAARRHAADASIQPSCLGCLGSLSLFNAETSLYAGRHLGAVELAVKAMRDHGLIMGGIIGCFQDFQVENRVRMRKAGGIKLLLDACGVNGTHYRDAKAQFDVWCAFSSYHEDDNYAEFRRLGGIESAVAIMRDHPKSYRVREEILQTTKGMLGKASYRKHFLEAGFLDALLEALREDRGDPQVTALGFDSLRMLIETDAATRAVVASKGAVGLVLQALRDHSAELKNTRADGDNQNVYGSFNDEMYNVPGSASEVLSALALAGEAPQREMLEAGVVDQLSTSIAVTFGRVQGHRTWQGSCATLDVLRSSAAGMNASTAQKIAQAFDDFRCSMVSGKRPPVICNYQWEP